MNQQEKYIKVLEELISTQKQLIEVLLGFNSLAGTSSLIHGYTSSFAPTVIIGDLDLNSEGG